MGIRVDREGRKMRDFHTVGGGTIPPAMLREYSARAYGVSRANAAGTEAALSQRYFLSDARFIVAMAGEDNAFLRKIAGALVRPKFQLFFGRKSFVPAAPLLLEDEPHIRHGESLQDILESVPWIPSDHDLTWDRGEKRLAPKVDRLRLVLEVDHTTADPARDVILRRPDDPVSFVKGAREFRERGVRTDFTRKPLDLWLESELRKEEVSP
jgi:CRISPR system Cascade subunit CasD